MLHDEYTEYIKNAIKSTSLLELQDLSKNKSDVDDFKRTNANYQKFLKSHITDNVKYLDDLYEELNIPVEEYILSQDTIDHYNQTTSFSIKRIVNPKKLIQYYLLCFETNQHDLDQRDVQNQVEACVSTTIMQNLQYSVCKYKIENDIALSDNEVKMLNKLANSVNCNDYKNSEEMNKLFYSIFNTAVSNIDTVMKSKLQRLMEKCSVTDYTLEKLEITQIFSGYHMHWISDYADPYYVSDGTTRQTSISLGWVATALGYYIATDGKSYYLSKINKSETIEYSADDSANYDKEKDNQKYKDKSFICNISEEEIIEYLTNKQEFHPMSIRIPCKITYFSKSTINAYAYCSIDEFYAEFPEYFEEIDLPKGCKEVKCIVNSNGVFYVKFKFINKPVDLNHTMEICKQLVKDTAKTIKIYNYSGSYKSEIKIKAPEIIDKRWC